MAGPAAQKLIALGDVSLKTMCIRSSSGDWAIVDGAVSALGEGVTVTRTLPLPVQPAGTTLFDVDGDAALVRTDGELFLIQPDGTTTLPIPGADMAKFVPAGILAAAPQDDDGHKLVLLTREGAVVAEHVDAEAKDAAASILVHPSGTAAVVELAMGQDGCVTLEADLRGGTLEVRPFVVSDDYVVSEFSGDGTRLLLSAHPNSGEGIAVMDWASRTIVDTLTAASVMPDEMEDAAFDLYASWVAPGCIVAATTQTGLHVVVTDGQLGTARLEPLPDFKPTPHPDDAEIMWLYPVSSRRFVARVWLDGEQMTRLYEVQASPRANEG